MESLTVREVALACHPESRSEAVRSVAARLSRTEGGILAITYSIEGDVARLRVPPAKTPRFAEGLWRYTCCECFIALKGQPEYHEFNFAPSGEWASYAFAKYRDGAPLEDEGFNPRIAVRRSDQKLELDASVPLHRLSAMHGRGGLALALSAVVEDGKGVVSYWALRHPDGRPDFHCRESFVLEVE